MGKPLSLQVKTTSLSPSISQTELPLGREASTYYIGVITRIHDSKGDYVELVANIQVIFSFFGSA